MNIFKSIAGMLSRDRAVVGRRAATRSGGATYGPLSNRHGALLADQCPTVGTCIGTIARGLAELDITADDAAIEGLLKNPNPHVSRYDLIHAVVMDLLKFGNAYVEKLRGVDGARIAGLAVRPPYNVIPKWVGNGSVVYEFTDTEAGRKVLADSDVIHLRDLPSGDLEGTSRIAYNQTVIRLLIEANRLVSDTFLNGATIGTVIRSQDSKGLTENEIKNVTLQADEIFGGTGDKRGGVLVVNNLEVIRIPTIKPADAELQALRQDLIREVAAIFGMPPFLAGATGQDKYANVTARLSAMYRDCYAPLIANLTERLSAGLNTAVRFNTADLLAGDLMSQTKAAVEASGGPVLTPNEARAAMGKAPIMDDEAMDKLRAPMAGASGMPAAQGEEAGRAPTDDGVME